MTTPTGPRQVRGALSNPEGRFESRRVGILDDGWNTDDAAELPPLETTVIAEHAKSILAHNDSPDVGFDMSINPYRGCEHGCVYCFAHPIHSYVNLSPGLHETAHQALMRSALRDPSNKEQVEILVIDRDTAESLARLFPGCSIQRAGGEVRARVDLASTRLRRRG